MNVLFFALRRADLCAFRHARRLLVGYGLTPARSDLLFFLSRCGAAPCITQIAEALAVSVPVISRMVRSLVELKLVIKIPLGLYRLVQLTDLGRTFLRKAILNVKKPLDRDVPERFRAAKYGVIEVLMKWEGHSMCWQQTLEKKTWLLYPYDHPDN